MKQSLRFSSCQGFHVFALALGIGALAFIPSQAHAQATATFTGGAGPTGLAGGDAGAYNFSDSGNWSGGSGDLSAGGEWDQINDPGATVDYFAATYGDFTMGAGSTLEITNGTFNEVTGDNWTEMYGNDTILVDGGTWDQGTDNNNPFNAHGTTGNLFSITSGVANFDDAATSPNVGYNVGGGTVSFADNLQIDTGNTYTQSGGNVSTGSTVIVRLGTFSMSGGTLTLNGGEFDFEAVDNVQISGGTLTTNQITGINEAPGATSAELLFTGGVIDSANFYGNGPGNEINFPTGSTGVFETSQSVSTLQGWVNGGGFTYNGATDASEFVVSSFDGTGAQVQLITVSVPEPSTALTLLSGVGMLFMLRRRFRS